MKTRTLLQIGFAGAAALCVVVGLAGCLALRQVHGIDNDVQGMERLQNRVNAALRASGDLVMTSGSSDTRKGLDAARSDRGGSGLGLAIVARLAQRYAGHCRLSNAPGGGLEVALDLPSSRINHKPSGAR